MPSIGNVALLSIIYFLGNWTNAIYRKRVKKEVLQDSIQTDFQGGYHFAFM